MAEKVSIWTEEAPQPFGHYSQAMKFGERIYVSGQLPLDPKSGKPTGGSIEEQTKQVVSNMQALLVASGAQMSNMVMSTLYLVDLRDFPAVDKVLKDVFVFLPPARTTIGVASLPGNARICMDAIVEIKPPDGKMSVI